MRQVFERYSNEKLEDAIASIYQEAHENHPGVRVNEEKHPFLGDLWDEFEARLEIGVIADDTTWEPKQWREGWYE